MKDKNSTRHGREETLTSLMTNTQSNLQSSYLSKILLIRYMASCQASLLCEVAKKGEKMHLQNQINTSFSHLAMFLKNRLGRRMRT